MASCLKCIIILLISLGSLMVADGAVLRDDRQSSGKQQDIYLGWLNWQGLSGIKPYMGPFPGFASQVTGPLSNMVLTQVPGAQNMYDQFDKTGNQLSGQMNFMNALASGQSNPLSSLGNFLPSNGGGSSGRR